MQARRRGRRCGLRMTRAGSSAWARGRARATWHRARCAGRSAWGSAGPMSATAIGCWSTRACGATAAEAEAYVGDRALERARANGHNDAVNHVSESPPRPPSLVFTDAQIGRRVTTKSLLRARSYAVRGLT